MRHVLGAAAECLAHPRLPAASLRRLALLLSASLVASGCQTYLHNEGRATATAELKAKVDKLSTPAYFEAQEKNLADLAQREDVALAQLLTASRDYRLLNVIRPSAGVSEQLGREGRLGRLIAADLDATFGTSFLSADQIQALSTSTFIRADAERQIEFRRRRVATTASQYKASGGPLPTACAAVVANPNPSHADPNQGRRYARLLQACKGAGEDERRLADCTVGAPGGDLVTVCGEATSLPDDPAAKARRTELAAAEKALREAMKAAKPSAEAEAVAEAQQFIDRLESLPSDEALLNILAKVEEIFGAQLAASLRDTQEGADTTAGEVSGPLSAALEAIGAAYGYRDAVKVKPAETASAMLIGIAKIRHELNMLDVAIEARRLDREIVLRQAEALRNQAHYLARAQKRLCTAPGRCQADSRAFSEALSFYVRSQDVGRAPYEILTFRRLQLQRSTALKEAKATEADYRSLIQPAIDQLAAYGAGGIKAETIAHFLSSLPPAGATLVE